MKWNEFLPHLLIAEQTLWCAARRSLVGENKLQAGIARGISWSPAGLGLGGGCLLTVVLFSGKVSSSCGSECCRPGKEYGCHGTNSVDVERLHNLS